MNRLLKDGVITVGYIKLNENISDLLTKGLARKLVQRHRGE